MSGTAPLAVYITGGVAGISTTCTMLQVDCRQGEWKSFIEANWRTPCTPGPHSYFHARKKATPSEHVTTTSDGKNYPNSIFKGGWSGSGTRRKFSGLVCSGPECWSISLRANRFASAIYYYLHDVHIGKGVASTYVTSIYSCSGNTIIRDGDPIEVVFASLTRKVFDTDVKYSTLKPVFALDYYIPASKVQFDFKYNEWETFQLGTLFGDSLGWLPPLGMHSAGMAAAYLAAIDDIPSNDVNMIENVLDAINLVKAFKQPSKALRSLRRLKDPRELWLTYRYCIKTGELDVNELRQFCNQLKSIPDFRTIKIRGVYQRGDILYRASGEIQSARFINSLKENAQKAFGLDPSLTNLWDVVPYSFIVDWFIPVQEFFAQLDRMGEAVTSTVTNVWYSYESSYDGQQVYSRFYGGNGSLIGLPYLSTRQASNGTVAMRVTDALAIFSK